MAVVVFATWKVKTFWDRFTTMEKKVEEHSALSRTLSRIDRQLAVLLSHFVAKKEIDPGLLKSESPLQLTELGTNVLRISGFSDVFPSMRQKFIDHVASLSPHTKLDLENAAVQAVFVLLSEPEMTPFKNWLYDHPQFKASETVTVSTNELLTTAGVFVRNNLLEDAELMKQWGIA